MRSMVSETQKQTKVSKTDVLVIGSGVAGLSFALKMANHHKVTLISKSKLENTNTAMAQGGIASVMASDDDFKNHIEDTIKAGANACDPKIVRKVVMDAPNRIADLEQWGVDFDDQRASIAGKDLHKEGGHSHRRILHVQDHTGLAIQKALMARAQENHNIEILEDTIGIELLTSHQSQAFTTQPNRSIGAAFLDINQQIFHLIYARTTFLATGGAGKTFLYTSNWDGATGDGIAMAYRAGCRISNMEFTQFHPTCLYHLKARNFLISEALRGEGAELVNKKGDAFTYKYNEAGPLAPRDIVARAIDAEMKQTGAQSVYLDIRFKGDDFLKKHFPFIFDRCMQLGYDLSKDLLPVVPAAHYLCGGILTDEHGKTDLQNLYAAGECANTGLHGANRLASNSLLECLAFAHYASLDILSDNLPEHFEPQPNWNNQLKLHKKNHDEFMLISHLWDEIRSCMWNYVGIVRSDKRLKRAKTRIENIETEINEYYYKFQIHPDIIELRNLACVAKLIIECALQRSSSIGTHYNVDHPAVDCDHVSPLNIAP